MFMFGRATARILSHTSMDCASDKFNTHRDVGDFRTHFAIL